MSIADYFVFPSHREGFPNVLLQAGAMQLPIICSNIPGNVDLIINNETGIIFEKQNEQDLLKAISKALENPVNSKQMAITLHKIIREKYDQQEIWKCLLNKYQILTAKN